MLDQPANGAHLVGVVNPGKPLASAAERPAGEEPEGEHHARQGAAVAAEDDAGADDYPTHTQPLDLLRRGLPRHAHLGEEIVAGSRIFGNRLVTTRAVVADGGSLDDDLGPGRRAGHSLHHGRARLLAAGGDTPLPRCRPPSSGDALAGQVDDGSGTVGQVLPALGGAAVPAGCSHSRGQAANPTGRPAQDNDLVLGSGQLRRQRATDEA